ncbi:MAG: hypothetical protein FWG10_01060 [Eubacteriaceae bacterium]|nr:hypothetical protein [Eubacteriaceae bacterium]
MRNLAGAGCSCYDITSVSFRSKQNEYVRYGHNRDKEKLPQINLGMVFGKRSGLPAFFRLLPGNINGVSTLQATIAQLDFIGQAKPALIMERGFYRIINVDAPFEANLEDPWQTPRCDKPQN